jgi:ferredoxin--NADP+ reductase
MTTPPDHLEKSVLTRHEEISPGVFVIGVERKHSFIPGQAVKLGIDSDHPPRIYSICSGNSDEELCVLFNIKDDGFLTPKLAKLTIGDSIYISEPYGTFLGTEKPAYWIATGTGIAPFRSMVRSGQTAGKTLIHGVRHLNQFYFEDELAETLGSSYFKCCSGEEDSALFHGRVTAFLKTQELPTDQKYYICGQAQMAVEARDILICKDIPFGNIVTEIYF